MQIASENKRFASTIIDGLLVLVLFAIDKNFAEINLHPTLYIAIAVIYVLMMPFLFGSTVGGYILGLRIRSKTGGRITFKQSIIKMVLLPCFGVSVTFYDWGERVRSLPDRISNTEVIEKRKEG